MIPVMAYNQIQLVKEQGHFHRPMIHGQSPRDYGRLPVGLRPAVFLDRDGVLVEDVNHLRRPEQLRVLPNVVDALRLLQDTFQLIVLTNQSGIARGFFTEEDLLDIHTELAARLWTEGAVVDGFYYCPHLADAPIAAYSADCECRKPKPGMVLCAGREFRIELPGSYLVGDRSSDIDAAKAAGVTGIFLGAGATSPRDGLVADDLFGAAHLITSLVRSQSKLTPEDSSAN